ncbi:GGDEF domain-containing protein [Acidisoma sp. 7E03]
MRQEPKQPTATAEELRPLVEDALRSKRLLLTFPRALEARFRADSAIHRAAEMRSFAMITCGLYLLVLAMAATIFHGFCEIPHQILHGVTVVTITLLAIPFLRGDVSFRARKTAFFLTCLAYGLLPLLFVVTEAHRPPIEELIIAALPISYLIMFSRLPMHLAGLLTLAILGGYALVLATLAPAWPCLEDKLELLALILLQAGPALVALRFIERSIRKLYLHGLLERLNYERALASNAVLTSLSYTDPLTGVANRRRMDAELARICDLEDARASFLMLDIDWFKTFNDHYGHPLGDRCLQEVATCLSGVLRDGDLLARMGGEEFGVLLPGILMQEAVLVAERLRKAVASYPFMVGTQIVKITVSIGISTIVPHDDPARVVEAADKALYRAKQAGRNQIGGPWTKQAPRDGLAES